MTAFKLPSGKPTLGTSIEEWADFAEYLTLKEDKVPFIEMFKNSQLVSDEIQTSGIDDEDDKLLSRVDEIGGEIRKRINNTNSRYPFQLESNDFVISLNNKINKLHKQIYLFLLFCTRLRMHNNRFHAGLDGSLIFEHLCAEVAKNYFGEKAHAEVMGTGNNEFKDFHGRLGDIAKKVNEFGSIRKYEDARTQDDKLDVIVWKGFTDNNTSKLIAFGQCKTGTSWLDNLSELQSSIFCATWFTTRPIIVPLRLFFCSQYFPKRSREQHVYKAGLLFDRYRIMDYLPDTLSDKLNDDISQWCQAVEAQYIKNT